MTTHRFLVTVEVLGWPADEGKDPGEYASEALEVADLPRAFELEGFRDMSVAVQARVEMVEEA